MSQPDWAGSLADRGASVLLETYARYPLELIGGNGCVLTDSSGREYLDFTAGIAVSVLGHGHPTIVRTIERHAGGLLHVSNLYWTEPMLRLAEKLTAASGMDKAFFCNSGAEAVEAALKLARRARPGRERIICFEGSFHGRTLGALSTTAQPRYQDPFRPLLPAVEVLPYGDFGKAAAAIDAGVAAVIVEPIQGEGGIRPAPSGWLSLLRDRCDETGTALIFDEVQSGIGRTGALFAYQSEGVLPDSVASAKALAGGLPMGALLARGEVAEAFRPGDHGSTFGGGPLVASVAIAVLDEVLSAGFLDGVKVRGRRLLDGLEDLANHHPTASSARGRGLMLGLVLTAPAASDLVELARDRGLLLCPAGLEVVRLVPPLIVSDDEIDRALAILGEALATLPASGPQP